MGKPKIVQLRQSPKDNSYVFDLQPKEVAMISGTMNGCVSVFILWGIANGQFAHVRGHHAGGGIVNVDWATLKAGVPANDPSVLVIAAYGPHPTAFEVKQIRAALASEMPNARHMYSEFSNCYVDRTAPNPRVRGFSSEEDAKYKIRGGGSAVF